MWFYNNLQTCDQTTVLVVSHHLLIIKTWAQSHGTPCGPCGTRYWGTLSSKHFSFPFPVTTPPMLHILLSSAAGTASPLQATTAKNMWWPTAKIIQVRNVQRHILIFAAWFAHCIVLILIWQPLIVLFLIYFPQSLNFSHGSHSSSYGLIYGPNIMLRRNPRLCCLFSLH